MRTVITAIAVLTLVACDGPTDTANDTIATEAETSQEPLTEDAAAGSWPIEPGTYEYTRSDGRTGVNTLAADGTYSNAIAGGTVETGTWNNETGLACFASKDSNETRCYTFTAPDAEGNFTGSLSDGVTITVRKTA